MIYLENNELYHHGVKGQNWGVIRKHLRSVGRAASAGGHTTAKAAIRGKKYVESIITKKKSIKTEVKNTKRKDPSKMSDDEEKRTPRVSYKRYVAVFQDTGRYRKIHRRKP